MRGIRLVQSIALLGLILFRAPPSASATPGGVDWSRSYDATANDSESSNDIVIDSSGSRVFVTGNSMGAGTNTTRDDRIRRDHGRQSVGA